MIKDLREIDSAFSQCHDNGKHKWFISFGSLLYLVRDRGKPFNQDIDISIIGEHRFDRILNQLLNNGFTLTNRVINDVTKEPLFVELKSPSGIMVDVFFWIREGDNYWHTYDYMREKKEIPTTYVFKSLPAYMFDGAPYKTEFEGVELNLPNKYGTLLDYWYPNWFIPDEEFGQSLCQTRKELKSCGDL